MEGFKQSLTEYSDFVNQYDGTDTFGLLNIGEKILDEAKQCLSTSEFAELRKSINEFYDLQLKLKDIDTQSISFKSHLIGFGIYIETKIVFIL